MIISACILFQMLYNVFLLYNYGLVNIVNLGSGTNQYFWEMGGNVTTTVIVVF